MENILNSNKELEEYIDNEIEEGNVDSHYLYFKNKNTEKDQLTSK